MLKLLHTKFKPLVKRYRDRQFNFLDVGAGNHSASLTKQWFPVCRYYGIDRTRDYDNNDHDFDLMDGFYELGLTKLEFDFIPDDFFDLIMMSHIIEHLQNGDAVIERLVTKLKRGA